MAAPPPRPKSKKDSPRYLSDLYHLTVVVKKKGKEEYPFAGAWDLVDPWEFPLGFAAIIAGFLLWFDDNANAHLLGGLSWVVAVLLLWEPVAFLLTWWVAWRFAKRHPEWYEIKGFKYRIRDSTR